jgi:cytochrome c-type biogenesis protein CcmE
MLKKQIALLFALVITFPLAMVVVAQEAPAKAKEARWEGNVIRSSKENSTLTVRAVGSTTNERTVVYDSSTKWVSQYHGDTKVNDITPDQVKEGDRVICTGTWDKPGLLHATLISLRLSHSPH